MLPKMEMHLPLTSTVLYEYPHCKGLLDLIFQPYLKALILIGRLDFGQLHTVWSHALGRDGAKREYSVEIRPSSSEPGPVKICQVVFQHLVSIFKFNSY